VKNGNEAFVLAPLGGRYRFAVWSSDCCGISEGANVFVDIECDHKIPDIYLGEPFSVSMDEYGLPEIQMTASASEIALNNLHFAWSFVSVPNDTFGNPTPTPNLINSFSPSPVWVPYTSGTYVLEAIETDGCSLSRASITVDVDCIQRQWYITGDTASTLVWGGAGYTSAWIVAGDSCLSPLAPQAPRLNTVLTMQGNSDYELIMLDGSGTLQDPTSQWEVQWSVPNELVNTTGTTTSFWDDGAGVPWSYTYAAPIQKFPITRWEGTTYAFEQVISDTTDESYYDEYYRGVTSHECYIDTDTYGNEVYISATRGSPLTSPPSWMTVAEFPEYMAMISAQYPFSIGHCEGRYTVDIDALDDFSCNAHHESFALDITCDEPVRAHTLSPCYPIYFNYGTGNFPTVSLRGSDSNDDSGRALQYYWNFLSVPATSPVTDSDLSSQWSTNPSFVPRGEGLYSLQLSVSNLCAVDHDTIDIMTYCEGDVTASLQCGPSSIVFNYTSAIENRIYVYGNGSSTTSTGPVYNNFYLTAPNSYPWSLPTPPLFWYSTDVYRFNPNYEGQYTVRLDSTDRCRSDSATCTVSVTCPNVLTVNLNAPDLTSSWDPLTDAYESLDFFDLSTSAEGYSFQWTIVSSSGWVYYSNNWIHNFTWAPPFSDTFNVTLQITDGCKYAKQLVQVVSSCVTNTIQPYIYIDRTQAYLDNATTRTIYVNASRSNIHMANGSSVPIRYLQWQITSPSGSTTWANTVSTTYWVSMSGTYTFTLYIGDGCTTVSDYVLVYVDCWFKPTANGRASSASVTWSGGKFPVVDVDGINSITLVNNASLGYSWKFLSAPTASVFKGFEDITYTSDVSSWTTTNSFTVDDYNVYRHYTYTTNTTTMEYQGTTLVNYGTNRIFGSCFRPDVKGTYKLQLTLTYSCWTSTDIVTVMAACNSAPAVSISLPASPKPYERMTFDATATRDSDNDVLVWDWLLSDCTDPADTFDITDEVFNSQSSLASWVPQRPGTYCLTLKVDDGCTYIVQDKTFTVGCNELLPAPVVKDVKYTFDGLGDLPVHLTLPSQGKNATNVKYLWQIREWTPIISSSSASTIFASFGLILALLLLL
jgi:hypothetical protein